MGVQQPEPPCIRTKNWRRKYGRPTSISLSFSRRSQPPESVSTQNNGHRPTVFAPKNIAQGTATAVDGSAQPTHSRSKYRNSTSSCPQTRTAAIAIFITHRRTPHEKKKTNAGSNRHVTPRPPHKKKTSTIKHYHSIPSVHSTPPRCCDTPSCEPPDRYPDVLFDDEVALAVAIPLPLPLPLPLPPPAL